MLRAGQDVREYHLDAPPKPQNPSKKKTYIEIYKIQNEENTKFLTALLAKHSE